jgi:hypothetical protein
MSVSDTKPLKELETEYARLKKFARGVTVDERGDP